MTRNRPNKLPAILSIALPLIGFFLILGSLNLYQYYKIKNNIAAARLAKIGKIELVELQSFFDDMSSRLNIVREWGKNGLLRPSNTVDLNKKFFPFMNSQKKFTGLLLADSTGTEYFLYRSATGLVTRMSEVKKSATSQTWQQWAKPGQEEKKWEEKSDYDPRKRPWFVSPHEENKVSWTKKYTFFQSGKPGLTASVSWVDPDYPDKYMVFGIDLLVEDIQRLLSQQQQKRGGIVFLTNTDAGYSIDSSVFASTNLAEEGGTSSQKTIIEQAIDTWNDVGRPDEQSITFTHDKQRWLAQFNQLSGHHNPIWIGVAGSEKDMASVLRDILFDVDIIDFTAAAAGGALMLFLVWRFGWHRTEHSESRKIDSVTLEEIINEGEGAHLEFKASVRYNFKSGKTGKEIEFAWLKAVVAFLNSGGGTLLLGVTDDGKPSGIDHDNFDNDDRCLLHVKNLINQYVGAEFSRLLNVHLVEYDGYQIVVVECGDSRDPVFLKVGKNEDFFIRSGPSNTKLSASKIINYLEKNRS